MREEHLVLQDCLNFAAKRSEALLTTYLRVRTFVDRFELEETTCVDYPLIMLFITNTQITSFQENELCIDKYLLT